MLMLTCLPDIKWALYIGNWVYESEIQGSDLAWRCAFGRHSHMNVRKLVTGYDLQGSEEYEYKNKCLGAESWVTPGQGG